MQEYSADEINKRHFQMQVFLAFLGLIVAKCRCQHDKLFKNKNETIMSRHYHVADK